MYEQTLPSLSMTALAAALKWIGMKPETTGVHGAGNLFSACSSHSIRHACLFLYVDHHAQCYLTVTYSSPFQG